MFNSPHQEEKYEQRRENFDFGSIEEEDQNRERIMKYSRKCHPHI